MPKSEFDRFKLQRKSLQGWQMKTSELSIEEKISLVKGMGSWHTNDLNGKRDSIHLSDGPHGLRAQEENAKSNNDSVVAVCFPTASAISCSFDRKLVGEMAEAIAQEALEAGVSVLLGPGVNMKRSPVCGRNFEYYSEDPYVAGELASSYVNAVQGKGVATSLKHFAGNSQETHRMTSNSMIDERALREIYLRAFEIVVKKAKPATIMASYNLLNGKPACENEWLLTKVLREEWDYEGLVMSDWGACVDAGACIQAGMDLEMPDSHGNHNKEIMEALKSGKLTEKALDQAVGRVMELVEKYPPKHRGGLKPVPDSLLSQHHELAVRMSTESAVLLKNEGILPLNNPDKVIIVGDLAKNMRIQGGGSSHIHTKPIENIIGVFEAEGIKTVYFKGYDSNSSAVDKVTAEDKNLMDEALAGLKKELSSDGDVKVLIFGGLTDKAEGEGYDRESYKLPANQEKLYESIKDITENVVFISFGGSPYDISSISYAKAILNMYLGGEGVASACVNLLIGRDNPSGKLSETWPYDIKDTPCYGSFGRSNEKTDDVPYKESLYIGYRYYDSFNIPVRYSFGHGMSYTSYAYDDMKITKENGQYTVSVSITNTGTVKGKETVFVFVKNPDSNMLRAVRELRAFEKIELMPGETGRVNMVLDDRSFDVYNASKECYETIAGEYVIEVSSEINRVLCSQTIEIEGKKAFEEAELYPSYFAKKQNSDKGIRFDLDDFRKLYGRDLSDFTNTRPGMFTAKNSLIQMAKYSRGAGMLIKIGRLAAVMITKAPVDDPETRMMCEGIAEGNIDSVCNQSGGIISHRMIEKIIKSANRNRRRK